MVDEDRSEPPSSPGASPENYVVKKPRLWPWLLVLLALAGGIAFAVVYFTVGKPQPLRVLVMIEYEGGYAWDGSKPAAALSDEVCGLLKQVGFDPVKLGDPAVDKVLAKAASPEAAAKSLDAAFVIYGSLKPTYVEEKLPAKSKAEGYVEARVDGSITVRQVRDPSGQASTSPIFAWGGALQKDEALALLQRGLVDQVFEASAARLMTHPTIVEILSGGDIAAASQIGDAREYMELRKARIDVAARAYDTLLSRLREAGSGAARKISFLTPPDEEDTLVGTGPDGMLVRVEKATRTITPRGTEVRFLENLENLGWRARASATEPPRSIWRGYHAYGRPAVGADGTVVMIEDMFKFAKAITKRTPDGWKRLRVDPSNLFSGLRVSPKGDAVAVWTACRDCPGHMTLVNLADGLSIFERPEDETNYGWTWLDDKRLAFIVKPPKSDKVYLDRAPGGPGPGEAPPEEPPPGIELRTFNLKTHEEITVGRYADSDGFASPVASPDGALIAVQHAALGADNVLALIDTKTGAINDIPLATSGAWPVFSPDGSLVAYTEHDDLRLLHVKDRRVETLTEDPLLEQNPMFSADGSELFFEVLDRDPVAPRRHVQIIASVVVNP
ncbi:MAG: hypothetical protein U0414_32760 [Polyangiaceae bacterium]